MPTRTQLTALVDELRRLKVGGLRNVSVSTETLEQLRIAVKSSLAEPADSVEEASSYSTRPPAMQPTVTPAAVPQATPKLAAPSTPATPVHSTSIPLAGPVMQLPEGDKSARWNALRELVLNDSVCRAHVHPGKKIVFGVGSLDARIFFCGEAPGAEEEIEGEPFVGPAGQLLTRMIQAMGLKREQVYIGNIMNWRPDILGSAGGIQVGNRAPTVQEMNYCLPYLKAQISIVQPELIVALGATAAGGLLGAGTFKTLGEIKGRWHEFAGKPVMVTYHPSYILRNNSNRSKRSTWEDLLLVMERAQLPISDKQRNFFL
ncbi:MAG: uracil-DNA glycosylase family protein [Lacunisphaera sp.]